MTSKEIYQIWAPTGKRWVDWVRPVPFVGMEAHSKGYDYSNLGVSVTATIPDEFTDAAVIVDLPGVESVVQGIALARTGYRPIPVYNGTIEQQGARSTVDNQAVGIALSWGAAQLADIKISEDALPAFLLDSNRMGRYKMEISLFDNSWDIYSQDMPSAEYFLNNDIHRIIIVGEVVSKDLKKILYDFQKKGIRIYFMERYGAPKKVRIRKTLYKN